MRGLRRERMNNVMLGSVEVVDVCMSGGVSGRCKRGYMCIEVEQREKWF